MDAETCEGLGSAVVGVEEVDGEGREVGDLAVWGENLRGWVFFLIGMAWEASREGQVPGSEPCYASGAGEADKALKPGAFGSGMEDRSKERLGPVERFDPAGIDENRAFGEEEPRSASGEFRTRCHREGNIEQRLPSSLFQNRRSNAALDLGADRAGLDKC